MSLIRCLGPIRLPKTYRTWMQAEIDLFRRSRQERPRDIFAQQFAPKPGEKMYQFRKRVRHQFKDDDVILEIPDHSAVLDQKLSSVCALPQQHQCLTLVEVDMHQDLDGWLMNRCVLVVYQASHLHFLRVEDEKRQMIPGMAYTFNQKREHALIYNHELGSCGLSKPFSAMNISFQSPRCIASPY